MPPEHGIADVTVITPAYRSAATIGRALRSIAAQTLAPKRVVVVDDGSDDDTVATAEACRADMNGIELVVLEQDHQGPGAARNLALTEADTTLVAFLDADDEWFPEKLARTVPVVQDGSASLVSHDMIVEQDGTERRADCARHMRTGTDAFVALFKRGFVATSTVVARTADIRACDGFDESLPSGQDYELWLAMARAGGRIVVLPDPLTRYHVTAGGVTSFVERRRRCSLEIAARHAAGLEGRTAMPAAIALVRAMIVSYEAATAHFARGRKVSALGAVLRTPAAAYRVIAGGKGPRIGISSQAAN